MLDLLGCGEPGDGISNTAAGTKISPLVFYCLIYNTDKCGEEPLSGRLMAPFQTQVAVIVILHQYHCSDFVFTVLFLNNVRHKGRF